ncbi:restriction endonuclease subunit S [Marinobacter halotolerans]|uniref:restriction endonuclease subunit S n=1 Tax=Marinobacter halotolerans TaxID=1569211 RepID=UPI0012456EED|nr:restriction endonuclease subunit S [Marinobacter halotolerans]
MSPCFYPKTWGESSLGEIGAWGSGGTPKRTNPQYYGGSIPWLVIGDLNDSVVTTSKNTITEAGLKNSSAKLVGKGTLLIAMYGSIGKLGVTGMECSTNQAIASCAVNPSFADLKFVFFYLLSQRAKLLLAGKGGAQQNISQTVLKAYEFPVPPLAEQKVIADKLDTLLAQVENTKARLERIPQILKRFRQSVLAAAVSGRLTAEIEPWQSKKLEECFECIDGDRGPNYPKKHEYLNSGYCLFLSTKNVRPFGFDFKEQVFISKEKDQMLRKGRLTRGDLVITTRGTLGHIASFDEKVPFYVVRINSGMLVLRKKQANFSNDYFKTLIASPLFRKYIEDQSTGSAQPQLPAKILKGFVLPVPSPEEQTEIVRRVDQLFAHAGRIEQQVNNALSRVNNLTQSILAKAFRGELTEQWRKDNPDLISGENSAEALLEHIKNEREISGKQTKKSKIGIEKDG